MLKSLFFMMSPKWGSHQIVCNTTKNDKNILIGDYSMEYTEGDCNN